MSQYRRKRIGECLIEAGLIDQPTLDKALELQRSGSKRLGQVLIEMGVADDYMIATALAAQLQVPLVSLQEETPSEEVIALVPATLAEHHLLVPIRATGKELLIAMANPLSFYAVDDLRFVTNLHIKIGVAPESEIIDALSRYYPKATLKTAFEAVPVMGNEVSVVSSKKANKGTELDVKDLERQSELPPIVRMFNAIMADAIRLKSSDVHIEPGKDAVTIRFRVDGVLQEIMKTDRNVLASLVSRVKIVSGMDIAERRNPQDGKSQIRCGNKVFDLRVSTMPTSYGEKVTIRILDPDSAVVKLDQLGLSPAVYENLKYALSQPQGMMLVTGPTGSGKSTTLYASLNHLKSPEVNIITLEDPVEYDIAGINQVPVNPKVGFTFASGLRTILRQDPDVVMVGEIRDDETAGIACKAAQTGHLVFSTLHTNDAPSTLVRLMDLGIEPFQLTASLIAVLGQRLVRKICDHCKVPEPLSPVLLEQLSGILPEGTDPVFWKGEGCELCQYKGYKGRMGIHEIMMMTPGLNRMLKHGVSARILQDAAEKEGYRPLSLDGLDKALKGLTTLDEIFRVAPPQIAAEQSTAQTDLAGGPEHSKRDEQSTNTPVMLSASAPDKVLVAEPNEVSRKNLAGTLEIEGYRVIPVENGTETLRLAMIETPNLILMDCDLPDLDATALIGKLKSNLATRFIPVIVLASQKNEHLEVEVIKAGADDFLTKPVAAQRLMARVSRFLKRTDDHHR